MSMNLNVYIGPYIEVSGGDRKTIQRVIWSNDDSVEDGRGELSGVGDHHYLIPARKLEGVDRKMSFGRGDECQPLPIKQIENEVLQFRIVAEDFLVDIEAAGGTPEMHWGVVCGVF